MPGLLGTMDMGARSMQAQQQGVQVAGHNIANLNNPAYSRQRVNLETSYAIETAAGYLGSGVDPGAIVQLRDRFLDVQAQAEASVTAYYEALNDGLQNTGTALGQSIELAGSGSAGLSAASQNGLARGIADLFAAFQGLSADPTSIPQRNVVVSQAAELANQLNSIDQRLGRVQEQLNDALTSGTESANSLFSEIAVLNKQILIAEAGGGQQANDLRDLRQQKVEELSKLIRVEVGHDDNGSITISAASRTFVSGKDVVDRVETYESGTGTVLLRDASASAPLSFSSGRLAGIIDCRDGQLSALRTQINTLASTLISEVNTVHATGSNPSGGTGNAFFLGSSAADIRVNPALSKDPSLVQAAAAGAAAGDNTVAIQLAQLARKPVAALDNFTFSQSYAATVAALGQAKASAEVRLQDQEAVQVMIARQRDSVSGVSLDEEMADMMKYQRAYEASARLVSVVDEMLESLLAMKR